MRKNSLDYKANKPDETLDLVDKNDQVIGEISKGEANSRPGLIHREISILIYDDDRVLLQQRSFRKSVDPGVWTVSVAGHVPKGMEPLAAAHQELREELGFDTDLSFKGKFIDRTPTETRIFYDYIGKFPGKDIVMNRDEVGRVRFATQEEYNEMKKTGAIGNLSSKMIEEFWSGKLDEYK